MSRVEEGAVSVATLLCALQLGDSSFPTGGYTLSHGLEAAIEIGRVRDVIDAEVYLRVLLEDLVGPTDLVAVVHASGAAPDVAEVIAIDQALDARKLARESREASRRAGRAMLAMAPVLLQTPSPGPPSPAGSGLKELGRWDRARSLGPTAPDPALTAYAAAVHRGEAPGTHPVVFGCVAHWLGLSPEATASVYLHGLLASFASALGRLLPVDHFALQSLIRRGHAVATPTIERALTVPWWEMASAAPEAEVFALIHERSLMRAFAT